MFVGFVLLWVAGPAGARDARAVWGLPEASVRAVVFVPRPANAVRAEVLWRLPIDFTPGSGAEAAAHVAIYRVSDGKRMENVYVREFSPDRLAVAFEAPSAGNYYVYGVPYHDVSVRAFSQGVWLERHRADNYPDFARFLSAETLEVEYRDAPPEGDPYIPAATRTEADAYFSHAKGDFQAYFVPSACPLNGQDRLPWLWTGAAGEKTRAGGGWFSRMFSKKTDVAPRGDTVRTAPGGTALVQVGLVGTAPAGATELRVRHTSLPEQGIDMRTIGGDTLYLASRQVRSVWTAVRVSERTPGGTYDLTVRIESPDGARDLPFVLQVDSARASSTDPAAEFVARIGRYGQPAERTRERFAVNPRFPVTVCQDYRVRSGRNTLDIDPATALPRQMFCGDTPLLASPVLLVFATANGIRKIGVKDLEFLRREGGEQAWRGRVATHDMQVELQAGLSAYGQVRYRVEVCALSDIDFRNITLEAGFSDAVTSACCDTSSLAGDTVFSARVREGFSGLWLGGAKGGVFVTVDPGEDNAFCRGDEAAVTLYKGAREGLIIGTGAMRLPAGRRIVLRCAMQLLPADYSQGQARRRNILWVRGDTLPSPEQAGMADVLVVDDPFSLDDPENDRRARDFAARGVDVVPYLRPFVLPAGGFEARVLASMGYPYRPVDQGRRLCFEPQSSIALAGDSLYRKILAKEYVRGVLLADTPYNRERIPAYSLYGDGRTGREWRVMLHEERFDASMLENAPWIDAVMTADTLGGGDRECAGTAAGLTTYFRMSSGTGCVLDALAFGQNAYGIYPDTLSMRRTQALWQARDALGIAGGAGRFRPWNDPAAPVRSSNPFVRISTYAFPDRLVAVCRNTAPTEQRFVPEFDFDALGIKRWEVDRLERPAIGGLQALQVLLMGDPVGLASGETAVLSLAWTRRAAD